MAGEVVRPVYPNSGECAQFREIQCLCVDIEGFDSFYAELSVWIGITCYECILHRVKVVARIIDGRNEAALDDEVLQSDVDGIFDIFRFRT